MKTKEERVFQTVSHILMIAASIACLLPFVLLFISSFKDHKTIKRNGRSEEPTSELHSP